VPKGGAISIEVADDGLGIDIELVKARAIEDGFVKPEALALMSEHDVLDLIFLPGFSTAPTVTTAAGRGVGMDVVRTNVGRLGGEIDVQTEVGAGTRFTLKLPLTVAISDALLARIGTETLAIPVSAVKAMVRVRPDEIQGASGAETVEVEGQRLDLVRLDHILGLTSRPPGGPLPVVALRTGRKTLAVVPEKDRWRSAGIVFDLAHPVADAGDDIAAAPIMNLVLESWPNHFQALYHAGISDFALGHEERARLHLTEFLKLYKEEDGFTRNARAALAKMQQSGPPAAVTARP